MKPAMLVGIILVVLGVIALAYPAFHYTKREEVLKIGPIQATADTEHRVPIPPYVGWGLILIGAGSIAAGAMKRPV